MFVSPGCFLGPQPNILQHSLSPGRDATRRAVEEICGVGGREKRLKAAAPLLFPESVSQVLRPLNTYYVPGTGTVLGAS